MKVTFSILGKTTGTTFAPSGKTNVHTGTQSRDCETVEDVMEFLEECDTAPFPNVTPTLEVGGRKLRNYDAYNSSTNQDKIGITEENIIKAFR